MRYLVEIARTGADAIRLHWLCALVVVASLVSVLLPYLVGLGISRGLRDEAVESVHFGADLYVNGERFGRNAPLPLASVEQIKAIPGVASVVPRIVGSIELGNDRVHAVVIGVALENFPPQLECIDGRLYRGSARNELVVGSELARKLHLTVGSRLPPFYHNPQGEHVSEVVGIFRSEASIWQAHLMVTSLETASRIFNQSGLCTDAAVYCRPGYGEGVRDAIVRTSSTRPTGALGLRVIARDELQKLMLEGLQQREGVFTMLFLLAFAIAILVVLVTSTLGQFERRREIGILKATGWQTDELLLRSFSESALLCLAGVSSAILLAYAWLRWLNGYWIASVFIAGAARAPGFRVPFRLTPIPVLLAFVIALAIVMSGGLYATWRAAITPPRQAMR